MAWPTPSSKPEHLLPCVVEHNCTTNGYSGFVLHECVEGLLVIVTPLAKQGTCIEQHGRKFLERKRRISWILFADKILVKPMPDVAKVSYLDRIEMWSKVADACSTWKHMRSTDSSSSSGRLRMNRLESIVGQLSWPSGCNEERDLERSSRTSSCEAYLNEKWSRPLW